MYRHCWKYKDFDSFLLLNFPFEFLFYRGRSDANEDERSDDEKKRKKFAEEAQSSLIPFDALLLYRILVISRFKKTHTKSVWLFLRWKKMLLHIIVHKRYNYGLCLSKDYISFTLFEYRVVLVVFMYFQKNNNTAKCPSGTYITYYF